MIMVKTIKQSINICSHCHGSGSEPDWSMEFLTEEEKPCWYCNGKGVRKSEDED